MDLDVIYEDNHIIVVIKQVGIPTQADKTGDLDMLTMVKSYLKEKYNKPGEVYLGLLHRLDRMVGGLIVFAKTSKAASRISEYIRNKEFKKKYIAILNGTLKEDGRLEDYLIKNEKLNMSRVVNKDLKGSKLASLKYSVISNFKYNNKEYTKVLVDLETGRHHQIRVQFANLGFPLYGDIKYGQKVNKVGQNLALYSVYLSFYHPTKDEYLEFSIKPEEYNKDKIWEL
jgi:23S rRNA pseudouridine1911/1915/1917 synthase